jgi:hypothetical protein
MKSSRMTAESMVLPGWSYARPRSFSQQNTNRPWGDITCGTSCSRSFQVGDFVLWKIQMTKDPHKLSPTWEGPYDVVEVTQPDSYRLRWEDRSDFQIPGTMISYNLFYMYLIFIVHFCLSPAALAHEANISVKGLHYVLVYISYNEILPLLHLFYFCANNILTSAVKDFTWLGYMTASSYSPDT